MADQAIVERNSSEGRLGEQYEIVENGVKVMVRAIAPPMVIKQLLAARAASANAVDPNDGNRLRG
jgi:hypothetical protein